MTPAVLQDPLSILETKAGAAAAGGAHDPLSAEATRGPAPSAAAAASVADTENLTGAEQPTVG
ncbi:MAG: hypothetical protein ACYS22_21905, partial [Planctomycetota bacterium]